MAALTAIAQLHAAIEDLREAGRREGIEPGGPLGLWLEAQVQTLLGLAAVLQEQSRTAEAWMDHLTDVSKMELRKAALAAETAMTAIEGGRVALREAQTAKELFKYEQESVTQRMVERTLPFFATELRKVLVIRETRWNNDARRRRMGTAAALALAIFIGGYGLRAWSDASRLSAFDRCLAHHQSAGGHLWCDISDFGYEAHWDGK
jgi:hypothetical protein